jgi:hypothetical protein
MSISLTELRQRLFQLADHVVETGEPLILVRNGVTLRLVREDAIAPAKGRLSQLKKRAAVIGLPLDPHESPARWSEQTRHRVMEGAVEYRFEEPKPRRRRK